MGKFDFVGTTSRVLSNEKYPGCPFQPDSFLLSLILIAVKRELEIVCQLVEAIRKLVVIRQIKRCRFRQIKTGLSEHLTMG